MVPPRSAEVGLGHGMATCAHRRWFRVLVRTAGNLEPHGVGPIRGVSASKNRVECNTSRRIDVRHSVDQKDVKMRPRGPTLGGSRSPAWRTNTPNQRQLKAMPLVSRKCRSRTHSFHTEFHTTLGDRETHDYTRARCGVRPRAPPGTSWGRAVPRV